MLRLLALVLLLANGLYFAWGNGLLLAYGLGPAQQGEPQHMAQQIAPASIKLLKPEEFKQLEEQVKAEREPKECMEAGPFDAAQAAVLRQSLADALPAAVWALEEVHIVPRWIVYLGKYANAEALAKKRVEIAAMNLSLEPLENPALEPGLVWIRSLERTGRGLWRLVPRRPGGGADQSDFPYLQNERH